ncbi:MAG: NADH-quinone oxidoreductase subunit L [SAR202 cluster bacterium]|nr:NADH-quinone oxidoreductase subunit L [SAR202 cluster bacterium]
MFSEWAAWAIIALPLAAFAINAFIVRPLGAPAARLAGYVTVTALAVTLVLSVLALMAVQDAHGTAGYEPHLWFAVGPFDMTIGIFLDPLTAIMLIVVSSISLLVQVYSLGYMRREPAHGGHAAEERAVHAGAAHAHDAHGHGGDAPVGDGVSREHPYADYPRYFAYMGLFTASMLGLVLSSNLIQLFIFWELVGLSSYLLIGFYHWRPSAAAAAKKAFIVTRIGDFGFLLALLYIFSHRAELMAAGLNPFDIRDLHQAAPLLGPGVVTWIALGLFAGAVGKSAQFPLHTWLPDAMEGPTPVSSLIHAATMVAAGVFLMARMFPLFEESATALNLIALTGGFTALFATSMGLVVHDIKRVLAFSTVSQLGYMMLAVGVGAPVIAMFHLFNHAFFKCLLFLGSGSVHHSVHTFDMRKMGGLKRWMPVTYVTVLIGAISLAGIFPLAGFWSKDEILVAAWEGDTVGRLVFLFGIGAAFMTAFYSFRMIYLTFHGEFRGGIDAVPMAERIPDEAHHAVHRHESPRVMTTPMVVLAGAAVLSGIVANAPFDLGIVPAHWFAHFLEEEAPHFNWPIAIVSTLVALGGIGLATLMYRTNAISAEGMALTLKPFHVLLSRRYYMDELYEGLIVRRVLYRGVFQAADWIDRHIVDGTVDLAGWLGRNTGRAMAQVQTGQVQLYGVGIALGVVVILLVLLTQGGG